MDNFGPEQFAELIVNGLGQVVIWVGSAVTAGIALFLVFLAIRKGIAFFQNLVDPHRGVDMVAFYDQQGAEADAQWAALEEEQARNAAFDAGPDRIISGEAATEADYAHGGEWFRDYSDARELGMSDAGAIAQADKEYNNREARRAGEI